MIYLLFTNSSILKEAREKPTIPNKNSSKLEVFMPKASNNSIKISNQMDFPPKPTKKQTLQFWKVKQLKITLIYTAKKKLKTLLVFLPKKK